jgi:lysine 2,3-aminomutase
MLDTITVGAAEKEAEDEEPPGSHASPALVRLPASVPSSPLAPHSAPESPRDPTPRRRPPGTGEASRAFRRRFYPATSAREWDDWRWQVRNRIRSAEELARVIRLSEEEREAIRRHRGPLPVGITPYYASLLDAHDPAQPLRRTVVPVGGEYLRTPGEADDPLGEDGHSPVPGIVHRYPDRVLFLVTGLCSTYCRYCTRSRLVGATGEASVHRADLEDGLAYIAGNPRIRDVLLSGGDPLTLDDDRLDWILGRLRRIPHVELVRIGTKQPAVMPQRVTADLVRVLRRHRPVWMSLHFAHPAELTPEVARACGRLADAGVPLGSQTVLLRGVNDDVETLKRLFQGLLRIRVRPYYLYQCDPVSGSGHFRTSVAKGLEVIRGLRGHTTGYAVPTYVIDAPGGGGKIPLLPESVVGREGDDLLLSNFEGRVFRYPDPPEAEGAPDGRGLRPCA